MEVVNNFPYTLVDRPERGSRWGSDGGREEKWECMDERTDGESVYGERNEGGVRGG